MIKVYKFTSLLRSPYAVLAFILVIGLFFRLYKLDTFYVFGHDQDLYSWIVKDIFVDRHLRLIGQLTSIEGVFIGPFFYYLLVPFFVLTRMNPIGAPIFATLVGLLTIFSIYYVFSKFFGKSTGLIGAFIYATSIPLVFFDRWVVPTQPTVLWSVWFLYAVFSTSKGEWKKSLPLVGLLTALIWNIHIGLLPLLVLIPLTIILVRKRPPLKYVFLPLIIFVVMSAPLLLFEYKYNFQQAKAILISNNEYRQEMGGIYRFRRVIDMVNQYFINNFLQSFIKNFKINTFVGMALITTGFIFLKLKKLLSKQQLIICTAWISVVVFAQLVSRRGVSEYYLANLIPIAVLLGSILIAHAYTHLNKKIVLMGLGIFLAANIYQLITYPDNGEGFSHKREIVQFIKQDVEAKGYACVGVNYITAPGNNTGFRYMLWEQKVPNISPGRGAPNYNIVIPCSTSYSEITKCSGIVGVIAPPKTDFKDSAICQDPNTQPLPMLGFTSK